MWLIEKTFKADLAEANEKLVEVKTELDSTKEYLEYVKENDLSDIADSVIDENIYGYITLNSSILGVKDMQTRLANLSSDGELLDKIVDTVNQIIVLSEELSQAYLETSLTVYNKVNGTEYLKDEYQELIPYFKFINHNQYN